MSETPRTYQAVNESKGVGFGAKIAVDMINEVVSGVTGIKIAVHLCRRAGGRARGGAGPGGRRASGAGGQKRILPARAGGAGGGFLLR